MAVSVHRLAQVVGVFAIMASAVSQEYGSGINFVLVNSLGTYPAVMWLVPLAMFVAGIVLLPKVWLFARFSQVMPRAGSTYVWLTRSLNIPLGFIVAFLWFIGIAAGIGFLAFSFAAFVASTLASIGMPSSWAVTPIGHLALGLLLIWLIFWLHYSGVRNYGVFVDVIFAIVLIAALIAIFYGFTTPQSVVLDAIQKAIGAPVTPPPSAGSPSLSAFVAVVALFMFAYGGLTGAASLGGEARDATRSMPRGIIYGWIVALILFTLVSAALFNAVPWWAVPPLIKSGHSFLATTPGLIGMVAPRAVNFIVNLLVAIIVGKTVAPQMLDSSRMLFAYAQDHLLPPKLLHTSSSKAPDTALLTTAILGSLFLVDATFAGWQIGVLLRAMSLVLVFGMLGIGAWNMRVSGRYRDVPWAQQIVRHADVLVFATLAIIVAIILEISVIVVPGKPWYYQPSFQALVAIVIGVAIYLWAAARGRQNHESIGARWTELPTD